MTYKVGMRVALPCGNELVRGTYLLAQVGIRKVCAVDLKTGNRYSEPVDVADAYSLTKTDLWRILACESDAMAVANKWRYKGNRIFSVDSK